MLELTKCRQNVRTAFGASSVTATKFKAVTQAPETVLPEMNSYTCRPMNRCHNA